MASLLLTMSNVDCVLERMRERARERELYRSVILESMWAVDGIFIKSNLRFDRY